MSLQLKSESPRCFLCDELTFDLRKHLQSKHTIFVLIHINKQSQKLLAQHYNLKVSKD